METMGKRINTLRKRAGLTQEQLAKELGVTAQAVSKWENDQSCPDVTLLPKLAEILGVSCDCLLGKEPIGAVVDSDEETPNRKNILIYIDHSKIVFPLAVLAFGIELLINLILKLDISIWTLFWADAVTFIGVGMMTNRISPFSIGITALGIYFLLHAFGTLTFSAPWQIVLAAFVVLWGISMLIDNITGRKHYVRKRRSEKYHKHIHDFDDKVHFEQNVEDGYINYECAFCSKNAIVYAEPLRGGNIELSFGDLHIDLSHCTNITEGAVIKAEASFGELCIILPKNTRVVPAQNTAFGDVKTVGSPSENADQVLTLDCSVSFGHMELRYPN